MKQLTPQEIIDMATWSPDRLLAEYAVVVRADAVASGLEALARSRGMPLDVVPMFVALIRIRAHNELLATLQANAALFKAKPPQ